jgi:hypothetical protein
MKEKINKRHTERTPQKSEKKCEQYGVSALSSMNIARVNSRQYVNLATTQRNNFVTCSAGSI